MTGILDKFYVEHGTHGAKVVARSHQLTAGCIADGEIDTTGDGADHRDATSGSVARVPVLGDRHVVEVERELSTLRDRADAAGASVGACRVQLDPGIGDPDRATALDGVDGDAPGPVAGGQGRRCRAEYGTRHRSPRLGGDRCRHKSRRPDVEGTEDGGAAGGQKSDGRLR